MKIFIQINIHDLANVCFVLHYRTQQISHQVALVQAYNSLLAVEILQNQSLNLNSNQGDVYAECTLRYMSE